MQSMQIQNYLSYLFDHSVVVTARTFSFLWLVSVSQSPLQKVWKPCIRKQSLTAAEIRQCDLI